MSFISPSTFVTSSRHGPLALEGGSGGGGGVGGGRGGNGGIPGKQSQKIRPSSSIATLVNVVKDPFGSVSGVVGSWYERGAEARALASAKQVADSKKRVLYMKLQEAASYDSWRAAAEELDALEGNDAWKSVVESPEYDSALVASRLQQLDDARESRDVPRMLFLVRTALTRDLGRMGNVELYRHSHVGTKDLIERYIDSALETVELLVDMSSRLPEKGPGSHRSILEQVIAARQAFGRSALLLSGGGTFGMSHNGVLKALWEHKLLPRIISGASAGSIVSAIMCTRTDEEIPTLLEEFARGNLSVFEAEGHGEGYVQKVTRFLKHGHLYDISHLDRVLSESLGDMTFQEAYNRTRRILNICVSSAGLYELPRLLNYVTAPNVVIRSAVAASCSVPLIFSPASLIAKDPRTNALVPWDSSPQQWIDGSVDNDLPMTRLAEMFNVNHFIVSQVNPHVVPFLERDEGPARASDDSVLSGIGPMPSWLHTATYLAKGEALYRLRSMAEFGIFPNALSKAASILNQKYSGDITILPAIAFQDFPLILSNPTEDFMLKSALLGERATWPKLSRIRNHCAIELALDNAVQHLRTRVVFSSSQVDLRQGAYMQAKTAAKRRRHRHVRENSNVTRQMTTGSGRPLTRSKRSMSQNSEPDASVVMAARGIKPSQRPGSSASGNSGHSAFSERHPHSIHLPTRGVSALGGFGTEASVPAANDIPNTAIPPRARHSRPVSFQVPPSSEHASSSGRRPSALSGAPDISSSGAETSGLYTSDDEDNGVESDGSATSTESPTRRSSTQYSESDWAVKDPNRNLFPHASQPPTPLMSQNFRPFSLTFTPASPPEGSETEGGSAARSRDASMSPTSKTKGPMSGPEARYKQLFHNSSKSSPRARSKNDNSNSNASTTPASSRSNSEGRSKNKKINALGLEIPFTGKKRGKDTTT